ncbi:MAG: HNH endonuclease, partial [Candidatus Methylumidiphilus sp.]
DQQRHFMPLSMPVRNISYIRWRKMGTPYDITNDIAEIKNHENIGETTKKALINARLGQGKFRDDLMEIWDKSCSVTGCSIPELLKASHIKPWRDSTNTQRLDPNNGLLLTANLDALFDSGLISFDDTGEMIVSEKLSVMERKILGIPQSLRAKPNPTQCEYLEHHRKAHKLSIE